MYKGLLNNGFKKCNFFLPIGYSFSNSMFWSKYRGNTITTEQDLLVCCAAVYLFKNEKFEIGPFSYEKEDNNKCYRIRIFFDSKVIVQFTIDNGKNVLLEYIRDDIAILEELVVYSHIYAELDSKED